MDREYFESINTFDELKEFCTEHGLGAMENVHENSSSFDDLVKDHIQSCDCTWEEIYDALAPLSQGDSEWYVVNGILNYERLDDTWDSDDFAGYKRRVFNECVENGLFDEYEEADLSEFENIKISPTTGCVESEDDDIRVNEEDIDKFFGINVSEV